MSALVDAARRYKGTPFRHRGRTARAVDCVGLLVLAFRDCGYDPPDFILYSTEPSAHGPGLSAYMEAALGSPVAVAPVSVGDLQPGDVVAMRFKREPHHVGMVADYRFGGPSLIHAHAMTGDAGCVVETRFSDDMIARITHVYRRPV